MMAAPNPPSAARNRRRTLVIVLGGVLLLLAFVWLYMPAILFGPCACSPSLPPAQTPMAAVVRLG